MTVTEPELVARMLDDALPQPERDAARNALLLMHWGVVLTEANRVCRRVRRTDWHTLDECAQHAASYVLRYLPSFRPSMNTKVVTWVGHMASHGAKEYHRCRMLLHVPKYAFVKKCPKHLSPERFVELAAARDAAVASSSAVTGDAALAYVAARQEPEPVHLPPEVEALLKALPAHEREVIDRSFGFGCEPEDSRTIGARLGLTGSSVRQLKSRILRQMTAAIKSA
jgi:RNA polymerase sigma factor (sigma-70 family)